eukprot:GHVT01071685.1.p1 GENE.GHVT01071685.1~~GHVT01071685.1.p1  ORF type:complete len:252 (-),score=56.75 GHVT01071685.1:929-1684(-)
MASLKPSLLRKLAAVGYGGTVGCARAEVSEVVVFLEEEIIRFRPREERKVLREVNEAWWPNFKQYCKALGVAVRQGAVESPLARLSLLDQIASIAVHDAYLDKVEAGALCLPPVAAEAADVPGDLSGVCACVDAMLQAVGLPTLAQCRALRQQRKTSAPAAASRRKFPLEAAGGPAPSLEEKSFAEGSLARLEQDEAIAAIDALAARLSPLPCPMPPAASLDIPLGFTTSDKSLRAFGAVFRILHGGQFAC